jgi:hypothetical protein
MRWRRAIAWTLLTPLLFVVTCSGILRGSFLHWKAERMRSVDAAVPDGFPVLAFWPGEGGPHCRLLLYGELEVARRELDGLQLVVPPEHADACASSFEAASRHGAWDAQPQWASSRVWSASFEVEPLDARRSAVAIDYHPDDDRGVIGEYETDGSSLERPRYLDYFGPGIALDLLPASVGATLLVFALVAGVCLVWARRGG